MVCLERDGTLDVGSIANRIKSITFAYILKR